MISNRSVFSPFLCALARAALHRAAAGVGLHAAARARRGSGAPPMLARRRGRSRRAAPRPIHGLPSRTIPPPTPVPQKTPSSEPVRPPGAELRTRRRSRPGRRCRGARACRAPPRGLVAERRSSPSQSGRLRALVTVPASPSTSPGEPTPTPASSAVSTPAVARRLAHRRGHRRRDVGRPALGRRRHAAPRRAPRGRRRRRPPGSSCRRGRCRRAWRDVPGPRAGQPATRRSRSRSALR